MKTKRYEIQGMLTEQSVIEKLNETTDCPQGCPGRDYDVQDGYIVCGICGWRMGPVVKAEKQIDYKSSPWGSVQSCERIAGGIYSICTASHGGIKLSRQRNRIMPDYMRCEGG